jgi:hypothetical protein
VDKFVIEANWKTEIVIDMASTRTLVWTGIGMRVCSRMETSMVMGFSFGPMEVRIKANSSKVQGMARVFSV